MEKSRSCLAFPRELSAKIFSDKIVIAVEVTDQPGGLSSILCHLDKVGINIEYLFAFVTQTTTAALIVFRVEQVDEAIKVLQENGVRIVPGDEVYQI